MAAGRKYGHSPQQVLDAAQSLYEKRLTSYPRSDCSYLPESQRADAPAILARLGELDALRDWSVGADPARQGRAWNDEKISAHHAIVPTATACDYAALSPVEQQIYFLIAQAYIAQFYPPHIADQCRAVVEYAGERFQASGTVVVVEGWKRLYRGEEKEEKEKEEKLPALNKGEAVSFLSGRVTEKTTQPPKRFTTATLLQAMKEIHRFIDDEKFKKKLKSVSGIGTEATRAGIIDELLKTGFLEEKKKCLYPTAQARLLVEILPPELTRADYTAMWEEIFERLTSGKIKLEQFLAQQSAYVTALCQQAASLQAVQAAPNAVRCPVCGQGILRKKKNAQGVFWSCSAYPDCKAAFSDGSGKPIVAACPVCKQGFLSRKTGKKGAFWGCGRYPDCKAIFPDQNGAPQLSDVKRSKK